jgi:hypothetical protein
MAIEDALDGLPPIMQKVPTVSYVRRSRGTLATACGILLTPVA